MWKSVDLGAGEKFEGEGDNVECTDVMYGFEELASSDYKSKKDHLILKKPSKKKQRLIETKQSVSIPDQASVVQSQVKEEKEEDPIPEPVSVDLPEWESFGLHPYLLQGLFEMGFHTPTPVQKLCIPVALQKGKDILGAAETGSGKTLAYGLPMLSTLLSHPLPDSNGLQCLIVTPTRELALQVTQHLQSVLQCVPMKSRPRVETIVGGINEDKQERKLDRLPSIVVGTMGRLQSFLVGRPHAHLANLKSSLRFLILDEADRLADIKHVKDLLPLVDILEDADKSRNKQRQTLLFSATLLNTEDDNKRRSMPSGNKKKDKAEANSAAGAVRLMEKLGRRGQPQICQVVQEAPPPRNEETNSKKEDASLLTKKPLISLPETISLSYLECTDLDKEAFLHWVVESHVASSSVAKSILVFVNTINATQRISATLALSFPRLVVGSLHANMDQTQRLRNLDRFKKATADQSRLLVCSDVAARGLDIPNVSLVIHFGIPGRIDTFIHRSGRCGRAGALGEVVSIGSGMEVARLGKIRSAVGERMTLVSTRGREAEMKKVFARVAVCKKLQVLLSKEKGQSLDLNWRKRTALEADLVVSDEEEEEATHLRQELSARVQIQRLQLELKRMLSGEAHVKAAGQFRRGRKRG